MKFYYLYLIILFSTQNVYSMDKGLRCEQQIESYFSKYLSETNNLKIDAINILNDNSLLDMISLSEEAKTNKKISIQMLSDAEAFLNGESENFLFYEIITDGPMFTYVIQANKQNCSIVNTAFYGYTL